MRKANPKQMPRVQFTFSKDEDVVFEVEGLSNKMQSRISGLCSFQDGDGFTIDTGLLSYFTVGLCLKSLKGVQGLELEFEAKKLGKAKKPYEKVTDECLDAIPPDIFGEIHQKINDLGNLTKDESENIKNTSDSSL